MTLRRKARRFTRAPVQTQAGVLRRLLRQASRTEWGRRFDFQSLARETDVISAYQARVPLHTYDDIGAAVERIRQGEKDILWRGAIRHFAVSSGTVSTGKIMPLSRETLRRNTTFSFGVGLQYMRTTRSVRILSGRQINMGGLISEDSQFPGTLIGEVSGFLLESLPPQFRFLYRSISPKIAFMPHWHEKMVAVVDYALGRDIRVVATVPTWAVVIFNLAIERYNERHSRTVRTIGEIWPNLQLFVSGGVALSSYRGLLEKLIGLPHVHFLETYGASEGFFAYQVSLDDTAMLLDLDNGIFYEFVRLDELHLQKPRRYTIGEVEEGIRYVPYITTCSGLWAYLVGDVIRFASVAPHKITVAGRTSEMIDRYGEAIFSEEARQSIERACQETGAFLADYHLTTRPPSTEQLPRLEWLIEFVTAPDSIADFAAVLDSTLCEINRHYHIRREGQAFDCSLVTPLGKGTFAAWLEGTRSSVSTQTKVRRMSEDTAMADALIALEQSRTPSDTA